MCSTSNHALPLLLTCDHGRTGERSTASSVYFLFCFLGSPTRLRVRVVLHVSLELTQKVRDLTIYQDQPIVLSVLRGNPLQTLDQDHVLIATADSTQRPPSRHLARRAVLVSVNSHPIAVSLSVIVTFRLIWHFRKILPNRWSSQLCILSDWIVR